MTPGDLLVPNETWNAWLYLSSDPVKSPCRCVHWTAQLNVDDESKEIVVLLSVDDNSDHFTYTHFVLANDGVYYINPSCWKVL
jgi:hypothetical protein